MEQVKEHWMTPYLCFSSSLCDDLKEQTQKQVWESKQQVQKKSTQTSNYMIWELDEDVADNPGL